MRVVEWFSSTHWALIRNKFYVEYELKSPLLFFTVCTLEDEQQNWLHFKDNTTLTIWNKYDVKVPLSQAWKQKK